MDPLETSTPSSSGQVGCEAIVREQIEILWRYQQRATPLDPAFIENHARMIVQVVGYMRDAEPMAPPERP